MSFPKCGMSAGAILHHLQSLKQSDLPWQSGKVLAYTYDAGDDVRNVARDAYSLFLMENALDFTAFPSLVQMERDVVAALRTLLRGGEGAVGNCTSGGTESILCAVKAARDKARAHKPHVTQPEMVLPITAHAAFHKAAWYLGLKPVVVPVDQHFEVRPTDIENAITERTVLVVASAPGYAQGIVDPIPAIGQIAEKHGISFHVDACVGGIHLSVLRRMGAYAGHDFDFSVAGVTSISVDMHKYGYSPKGASVVLYRDEALRRFQIYACLQSTTYAFVNSTAQSTKSGGPLAGAWATLHFLGEDGYRDRVAQTQDAARRLIDGVRSIPSLYVLGDPKTIMFSFASDNLNVYQIADEMKVRGWYIQPQFTTPCSPPNLHVTVTPATVPLVDEFICDLAASVEAVSKAPPIRRSDVVAFVNEQLARGHEAALDALRALSGMQDGLPDQLAMVNTVLDVLPRDLAESLLVDFVSNAYT